jgi:hypothetical protein
MLRNASEFRKVGLLESWKMSSQNMIRMTTEENETDRSTNAVHTDHIAKNTEMM